MFRRWLALLSLVMVALISATVVAQDYDSLREYHEVELGELKKQPQTYKNTEVQFKIYFHQIDNVWSPFFSPFADGNYVNFSGWSAEKHLWKKEHMVQDFPFLYIRNEAGSVDELLSANKYDLLRIKGTVKSAFESHPWIEVRHIDVIRRNALTKKQLQFLILGGQAHKNDQPTEATRYFEKGLKTNPMTAYDQAEVLKHLAINYYEAHDYRNAIRGVERYEDVTGKRNDLLHRVRNRSRELMKMSPEERNAELKEERDDGVQEEKQTGLLPEFQPSADLDPSTLQQKYTTLLSRHEQLLREHQSMQNKHASIKEKNTELTQRLSKTEREVASLKQQKKELEQKLSQVYQKNARLLAKLRKMDRERGPKSKQSFSADRASDQHATDRTVDQSSSSNRSGSSEFQEEREKLLSRIRILKRRNQSLRTEVSTLSGQRKKAQQEIERLQDQVRLKTSAAAASETSPNSSADHGS